MTYLQERLIEELWHLQRHPRKTPEMLARIEQINRQLSIELSFGASGHADVVPVPSPLSWNRT